MAVRPARRVSLIPAVALVEIEVPRGAFVKWRGDGTVAFWSPLPCPFNYGSVPDVPAADGDPLDAIVLHRPLARGSRARWPVHGAVRFVDGGVADDKLVCARVRPTALQLRLVLAFFRGYAIAKRLRWGGPTRLLGYTPRRG